MIDVEGVLKDLMERFNRKAGEDQKLRDELRDVTRSIAVEMRDGESYHFLLKESQLVDLTKGAADSPDIKIISDTETFEGLISRRIGPMKALATGKLKLEASLEDKLRIRKLL